MANSLRILESAKMRIGDGIPEESIEKVTYQPLTNEIVEQGKSDDIVLSDNSEIGFSTLFVKIYSNQIRYDLTEGKWYYWDKNKWKKDNLTQVRYKAITFCRTTSNGNKKQQTKSFVDNVLSLSTSHPDVAVSSDVWDANKMVIGSPNGPVDLTTGKLIEAAPNQYITKTTLVAPDFSGQPPKEWLKFLHQVTRGDQELIEYLQMLVGYTLTGSTIEHILIFIYGPGGNGKSVFIDIVHMLMASYSDIAAMSTFTASKNDQHPADLAKLQGARLAIANETESNRSWAESKIKSMTGGDPITARYMRKDFFTYTPQFKIWIVGNYKPNLRNVDDAMRRRLRIIPFLFKPEVVDPNLKDKLVGELPLIFAWAIEGCLKWQSGKMKTPDVVKNQTDEYFEEQDIFTQFIEDRCIVKTDAFVASSDLFKAWSLYAKANGMHPETKKAISDKMQKRYFENKKKFGVRGFIGLELKEGVSTDDWTHNY